MQKKQKIHYVWYGEKLKPDDMANILEIAEQNPDFEVNIWTENPRQMRQALHDTAMLNSPVERSKMFRWDNEEPKVVIPDTSKIKIRSTLELEEKKMEKALQKQLNSAGITNETGRDLNAKLTTYARAYRNSIHPNFAASSDIDRLRILALEPGIYLDVDSKHQKPLSTKPDTIKGFNISVVYKILRNNSILGFDGKSFALIQALINIKNNHHNHEGQLVQGTVDPSTKRGLFNIQNPQNYDKRMNLTMLATGILAYPLDDLVNNEDLPRRIFAPCVPKEKYNEWRKPPISQKTRDDSWPEEQRQKEKRSLEKPGSRGI